MNKVLIFAGTTEGRALAEFCAAHEIPADVSTATAYGSSLLPDGIGVLSGRLDAGAICILLRREQYALVIDATHPYAGDATENIRAACQSQNVPYRRLLRKALPVIGESVTSLDEMTARLSQCGGAVLSTLGSKSLPALTAVRRFRERLWLRLLPSDTVCADCVRYGFDPEKLILEKGPFSTEQNLAHIRLSGAQILLTKESGTVGGYPEKAEAAKIAGIRMITLRRPAERDAGCDASEIQKILLLMMKENSLQ